MIIGDYEWVITNDCGWLQMIIVILGHYGWLWVIMNDYGRSWVIMMRLKIIIGDYEWLIDYRWLKVIMGEMTIDNYGASLIMVIMMEYNAIH